jgi:PAS domain S-box-containing protein
MDAPGAKGISMENASSLDRNVLEQLGDAVIYVDRIGTIFRWNNASAALFGYSSEEALNQNLDLIIPTHLRAAHWSGFDTAVREGVTRLQGKPTLTRALHKSGRKLYIEMTFAIVKDHANASVLGSVAVARDVTERVERERAASRVRERT